MNAALYLVLAHLILDYPLQGEFLAKMKTKYIFLLLVHAAMWGLGMCAMLDWFGLYQPWMVWWMVFGHMAMDWLKCHKLVGWCRAMAGCGDQIIECHPICEDADGPLIMPHRHPLWVTDPLGLPLWIDQTFHLLQIAICLL